jgi:uncharacterized membrane protein
MSYYELLLFGHLVTAMIWIGGSLMIQMFFIRARSRGPEAVGATMGDVEWIGNRLIIPATLLLVILGVLLVIVIEVYEFSQFWIAAALGGFALSFVTGAGFLGPETGRISTLVDERGAGDPEVQSRITRVVIISRIEFVVLLLIVLDMVLKPGL